VAFDSRRGFGIAGTALLAFFTAPNILQRTINNVQKDEQREP